MARPDSPKQRAKVVFEQHTLQLLNDITALTERVKKSSNASDNLFRTARHFSTQESSIAATKTSLKHILGSANKQRE
jgi:hypothetical protein